MSRYNIQTSRIYTDPMDHVEHKTYVLTDMSDDYNQETEYEWSFPEFGAIRRSEPGELSRGPRTIVQMARMWRDSQPFNMSSNADFIEVYQVLKNFFKYYQEPSDPEGKYEYSLLREFYNHISNRYERQYKHYSRSQVTNTKSLISMTQRRTS